MKATRKPTLDHTPSGAHITSRTGFAVYLSLLETGLEANPVEHVAVALAAIAIDKAQAS